MAKNNQTHHGSGDNVWGNKITNIFKSENRRTLYIILWGGFVILGFSVYAAFKEQDLREVNDLEILQNKLAEYRDLEKTFAENGNTEKIRIYSIKCDSVEVQIEKLIETISRVYKTLSELPLHGKLYAQVKPYIVFVVYLW